MLYIFVNCSVNVLYITLTSSLQCIQYFFPVSFLQLIHHHIYVLLIHYSPVVVGYVAALIMDVFRYLEDGQMIAYITYYQPSLCIRLTGCEYIIYQFLSDL